MSHDTSPSHGGILYILIPNSLVHDFFLSSLHNRPPLVIASPLNNVISTGSELMESLIACNL